MKKVSVKVVAAFLGVVLVVNGCTRDDGYRRYRQLMKAELTSGKRADSIFFGIHFGMTGKEFFTYCWDMNKKGIFTDGQNNTAVLYKLSHNDLKYPASMNFYPEMQDNKVTKMHVTFQYDAWAPWNKRMFSDKLLPDVLNLYKKWYSSSNPFIEISAPGKSKIYVKVDGNRRIIIGIKDDMIVRADYTDLLAGKQLK